MLFESWARSLGPRWTGAAMALASAVLFGVSTPIAKILLGTVDPWLLAGLLYAGAGVGLLLFRLLSPVAAPRASEAPLRRTELPWLAGAIFSGGIVGPVLLMIGLATTTSSSAALLLNFEGLATMGIAWWVFRESVDRRILMGAGAIVLGGAVLSWNGEGVRMSVGVLSVVGACVAWGIDNNLTRKISNADPVQIAMIKCIVGGGANLIIALGLGAALPSIGETIAASTVGLFGYGISLVMFVLALRHVGAARTSAYFSTAPFIGAIVGVVLFAEVITLQLVLAAILMAAGVYIHLAERHDHLHEHEPLEHEHAHAHDDHHQHEHGLDDPPAAPHSHWHRHARLVHRHPHFPDQHHLHTH